MAADDVEKVRATSWTGSERQRREQGVCLPPKKPPVQQPRYRVHAGTPCSIKRLSGDRWQAYKTVKDIGFERYERHLGGRGGNYYEFRAEGWLMLVKCYLVTRREMNYP